MSHYYETLKFKSIQWMCGAKSCENRDQHLYPNSHCPRASLCPSIGWISLRLLLQDNFTGHCLLWILLSMMMETNGNLLQNTAQGPGQKAMANNFQHFAKESRNHMEILIFFVAPKDLPSHQILFQHMELDMKLRCAYRCRLTHTHLFTGINI